MQEPVHGRLGLRTRHLPGYRARHRLIREGERHVADCRDAADYGGERTGPEIIDPERVRMAELIREVLADQVHVPVNATRKNKQAGRIELGLPGHGAAELSYQAVLNTHVRYLMAAGSHDSAAADDQLKARYSHLSIVACTGGAVGGSSGAADYAAYPVTFSTTILMTTRTAPGRSGPGSLPSYFQESRVSSCRPTSGLIDTRPRSST